MPEFRYVAITPAGDITRGMIDAAGEADVVSQLRRQGNIPARIEKVKGRSISQR